MVTWCFPIGELKLHQALYYTALRITYFYCYLISLSIPGHRACVHPTNQDSDFPNCVEIHILAFSIIHHLEFELCIKQEVFLHNIAVRIIISCSSRYIIVYREMSIIEHDILCYSVNVLINFCKRFNDIFKFLSIIAGCFTAESMKNKMSKAFSWIRSAPSLFNPC